jgi:NADPH:quinone reductase-like Zn-dependent oxidoreductase
LTAGYKVIDYRGHSPLHAYLSDKYSSKPFDAILDTIGVHELYINCPAYLKQDGVFVNVGAMEGISSGLWSAAKNSLWPQILGGTPRKYILQQTNPDKQTMQYLSKLVEERKLSVVVDQVFEMENALDVSYFRQLNMPWLHKINLVITMIAGV